MKPKDSIDDGVLERSVRLPLENIAFVLEQYVLDNGSWLDPQTRWLIAGIRDSVREVAATSRRLGDARRLPQRQDAA